MRNNFLPSRWTQLIPHEQQMLYSISPARFNCVSAGRRSGKSENAKRKLVTRAIACTRLQGRFAYFAPTRDQAKMIAWEDLKLLVPRDLVRKVSESHLTIWLVTGTTIQVIGMDKHERAEGGYFDGVVVDEVGDMKPDAWSISLRPALSTLGRPGWADFIGKPKGRNHWYDMVEKARDVEYPNWRHFTWPSSDILPAEEIQQAKEDLDLLTFQQEYEASFVNFTGQAYYNFTRETHASKRLEYRSDLPLVLAFDFNVEPGIGLIGQEIDGVTCWLDEIYIPRNSNTMLVIDTLIARWRDKHSGLVYCYGDASGGSRGSAQIDGSDWDLIRRQVKAVRNWTTWYRIPRKNPAERSRINAVNTRLLTVSGAVKMLVDPRCKNLIRDFEGVVLVSGGIGQIDKKADKRLTHMTDAIGYEVVFEHPVTPKVETHGTF